MRKMMMGTAGAVALAAAVLVAGAAWAECGSCGSGGRSAGRCAAHAASADGDESGGACPTKVEGARTVVTEIEGGVRIEVTGEGEETVRKIREAARRMEEKRAACVHGERARGHAH